MSTFKIGEKVVCVDASIGVITREKTLCVNEIYTIDGFNPYSGGLILKEVKPNTTYQSYSKDRFRKLDYQFAESLLAELTQSAKSEYQLN